MRRMSGRVSGRASRVRRFAAVSVFMWMPLGACASGGIGSHADQSVASGSGRASSPSMSVVVNNQSWDRVTVFIGQGGTEWRIGDVEPMTERTLPLGRMGMTLEGRSAYFVARRLAGGVFRSETFPVSPGGGVPRWTIENYAAFSYVMFR